MKLNEVLQSIAKMTGQDQDESIKSLLANEALAIDVDDSIKEKFTSGIYSKDAAKNDREIQDYYYEKIQGGIYGKFDEVVNEHYDVFGIDENKRSEISGYDSTMKRLKGLLKSAKDSKKADKPNTNEVEELNKQIIELKKSHESSVAKIISENKNKEVNFLAKNKVFEKKLIDNIPGGKDYLASATINKLSNEYHLQVNDNHEIEIKRKDDPTSDVFINNEKATFDSVLSKELDQFIKRNEDAAPPKERKRAVESEDRPLTLHEQIRRGKTSSVNYK